MGVISCCKKNDENNEYTMFYQSREGHIQDLDDMKAKNENNVSIINITNQEESFISGLKEEDFKTKKFRSVQKTINGFLYRIKFRQIIRAELYQKSQNLLIKHEEDFTSVYQLNLAQFNTQIYNSSHIYNEEDGNLVRIFKCALVQNEQNQAVSLYKGEVNLETEKHGFGILYLKNSSYFEGYWIRDTFSCLGRYIDESGCLYEGKFLNGKLNGEGMKLTQKGSIFRGNFVDGYLEGFGYEESDELSYEGNFEREMKSGKGNYFFKLLNEKYDGISTNNEITGYGTYVWNNKESYEGPFLKGKMHGKGKYKWPEGGEYEGDYFDNIKTGMGIFKWSNGKVYEGSFADGKPHGSGIIKSLSDNKYEVVFVNGKIVNKTQNSKI